MSLRLLASAALAVATVFPAATFAVQDGPATRPTTQARTRPVVPVAYDADAEPALDELPQQRVKELLEQAAKSIVVVRYVWEGEDGRRDLEGQGLVVRDDGLVLAPIDLVPPLLPDAQVKDFKIVIPNPDGDPTEVPAVLGGRDERTGLVFIRPAGPEDAATTQPAEGDATPAEVEWTPLKLSTGRFVPGQPLASVARLPEGAGYQPYVRLSRVSAELRGPVPSVLVDGALAGVGGVVLDAQGRAVGYVDRGAQRSPFLTGTEVADVVEDAPRLFIPAWYLTPSLDDPADAGDPQVSYSGIARMNGLTKELREYYGLGDTPAIQVGDLLPDSPAADAGVKAGDVIVAVNGQSIERGDTDDELPAIFNRIIARIPVGQSVGLTLLDAARNSREAQMTLEDRPRPVRQAQRFFAEDLGFSVRELVLQDTYARKLPADAPGVAVAFVREQSNAAAAGVRPNDLVRRVNQTAVEGLASFETAYKQAREIAPQEAVVLEVLRGAETQVIRIEAPR